MGPDAEPAPRDRGRLGPEGDPVVAGLSLSRYAAVTAALGDSFPLADVLATLAVDAAVWPSAKPAWGVRLAGDPALFDAYKARLAAAEDRLERQLPPIDRDLGAWMSFLAAWGAHAAPTDMLAEFGLRMNDLSRLSRRWARKMAEDPKLEREAERIAKKGGAPAQVPPLAPGECSLAALDAPAEPGSRSTPVPARRATDEPAAAASDSASASRAASAPASASRPEVEIDRYASICAELAAFPTSKPIVLARFGLCADDFAAVDSAWRARFDADPELARDFRALSSLADRRVRQRGRPLEAAEIAPAPQVAHAPPPVAHAPPPVAQVPPPVAQVPPPVPQVPPAAVRLGAIAPAPLRATSMALDVPRGPALPFGGAPAAGPASPARRKTKTGEGPRKEHVGSGTVRALDVPRGAALPFARSSAPEAKPASPAVPQVAKPPAALVTTAPLPANAPKGPATPFRPDAAPGPAAGPPIDPAVKAQRKSGGTTAQRAVKLPGDTMPFQEAPAGAGARPKVVRSAAAKKLAESSLSLDIPRGPLPPAKSASAPAPAASAPAPAASAPAPAASAPAPSLPPFTLEQHASLSVEVALAGARVADVLSRYRIDAATKDRLDAHFRAELERDPSLRSKWNDAYRTYYDWVARGRRT